MKDKNLNVLMIAAECRGFAKVGGLADVVTDLSKTLSKKGVITKIILPYYSVIKCDSKYINDFEINFGKTTWNTSLYKCDLNNVEVYLIKNNYFFSFENGEIYIDSSKYNHGPFEDDAKRFAFFSKAVLDLILKYKDFENINILHCHDWHTGSIPVLLKYDNSYKHIAKKFKTIFTIHNLDYQGVRPIAVKQKGNLMSFMEWYPSVYKNLKINNCLSEIKDLNIKYPCYNPMKTGIKMSDFVNTVSPTYSIEITQKDDDGRNFFGGRLLENELKIRKKENKLLGILNGLDYEINDPQQLVPPYDITIKNWEKSKNEQKRLFLLNLAENVKKIDGNFVNKKNILKKINSFDLEIWNSKPLFIAVTRIVSQKIGMLIEEFSKKTIIEEIMKKNLNLIIIGRGDLEDKLKNINKFENGLYINAFASDFVKLLYPAGDVFLMPSDFEPCGISQMIAMRYGCLPLVHDIGGLHDTVKNLETGFVYTATNREALKYTFLETIDKAIYYYNHEKEKWKKMQENAMNQRFLWDKSANEYINIYRGCGVEKND